MSKLWRLGMAYRYLFKKSPKYFCIGRNKTGTTSLKSAFELLGFKVGNQRRAERLLPEYKTGNFEKIIDYCLSAQVFQDFPFSYPETFKHLDRAFPNSKFILTLRDSPEQWYQSLLRFHSKLFGDGDAPTREQLMNATYVWKGFVWECNRLIYESPEFDPYRKEDLIKSYIEYNNDVLEYFKDRPDDLLIINIAEKGAYARFVEFIGVISPYDDFPWENRTN